MAVRGTADGVGKWMGRDRSDGSLVGRGGVTPIDLDGEAVLELGWAVRDARTGRGYATELGRAALDWAATYHPDHRRIGRHSPKQGAAVIEQARKAYEQAVY